MGAVDLEALIDLQATTIAKLPINFRNELTGQSYQLQQFLKAARLKRMSGKKVEFRSMLMGDADDTDDAADGVGAYGAYEVLGSEANEYMIGGEIPWAYYEVHWTLSTQESALNAGKEGFIDIGKEKIEGCLTRFANVLEKHLWSRTGYLHETAKKPWMLGIPYWITHDGYHVNDSSGTNSTKVGGIDPATSTYNDAAGVNRWRNQYNSIDSPNKLPDALEDMFIDTKFKAPPKVNMSQTPQYSKYRIVMDKTTYKVYQRLTKRLRDNVGIDVATGQPIFNNLPLEFSDRIPDYGDTTYETYFMNMDGWRTYIEPGNNFRRGPVQTPTNQDVRIQRIYFWPAILCVSRRTQGVICGYGATLDEA